MIVADTNILAYLVMPSLYMDAARALYRKDSEWAAPFLWRSEFNNIMALAMRKGLLRLEEAKAMQGEIADLLAGREYFVPAGLVLELAEKSGCTAYDCEFAALALRLDVKLVSMDRKLLRAFPGLAVSLA